MRIICEHVFKDFECGKNKFHALEDVNVETEEHDFVCILGPNGCGKTTLLKIMAGILSSTSGNVHYAGNNNSCSSVSLIFQEQGLFPWLSVIDNICFNLEMRGLSKQARYKKAGEYIEKMDLTKFINCYPYQLSAGMKQKASLIRGLLTDSPVLLIDEAYSSLDIYAKLVIQEDIYKIWDEYKRTVIHVTHDIEGALGVARHIWVMSKSPAKIIKTFNLDSHGLANRGKESTSPYFTGIKNQITDIIKKEAQKTTL